MIHSYYFNIKGTCMAVVGSKRITSLDAKVRFVFEDWGSVLNKIAVFKNLNYNIVKEVIIDDDTKLYDIPDEVICKPGVVVCIVYGSNSDGFNETDVQTNPVSLFTNLDSKPQNTTPSTELSDEILNKIEGYLNDVKAIKDSIDDIIANLSPTLNQDEIKSIIESYNYITVDSLNNYQQLPYESGISESELNAILWGVFD